MNQPKKPINWVPAVLILLVLCAFLAIGILVAPKGFFNRLVSVQQTAITEPVQLSISVPATKIEILVPYTIKQHDNLTMIARASCGTIDAIATLNNIENPDLIYAGKTIFLLKVENCAPRSPTSLTQTKIMAPQNVEIKTQISRSTVNQGGCNHIGSSIHGRAAATMAIADCIKRNYGAMIKDGIATIDGRVPPLEVVARMIVESKGNPFALNEKSDCRGLMQLQPGTAKQYGVDPRKIYDPQENIFGGIRVMSDYTYRLFGGNIDRGRVAYNAGPYSKLFRNKHFDPSQFKYVRDVRDVLAVLEKNKFSL